MPAIVRNMAISSYKIVTFGCQMNLADSGSLAAILNAAGYQAVASEQEADLIILNTCSVREKAEERVFGRLGDLSAIKRENPACKIVVAGCMAQRLGEKILERAPYVDFILGTDRMFDLPKFLQNGSGSTNIHTEFGHENIGEFVPVRDSKYASYVTIMRGCNQYCTYCIVPYVRGEERSYPKERIINEVTRLAADGVLEIMLLGQNVNSYRDGAVDFAGLLRLIVHETDIKRIRFMTSHPKDLSDNLIEVMANENKMMAHLHLPLQSGADRILGRMGRAYTYDHYRNLIAKLRAAIADISLTTDLIVGFPSETEDEYQMTLKAMEEIKFDSAFMFRYSRREGTAASKLEDDIPEAEKIRRLIGLIDLQKKISYEKNQADIGKIRAVLLDGVSRRDKLILKGKTEGYKTILAEGDSTLIGTIKDVRVTVADSWTLHGVIAG
jgi:tRNA-2-methylthio-N6-dimethylallyladenosine synthase